jgi:hypothetical protein
MQRHDVEILFCAVLGWTSPVTLEPYMDMLVGACVDDPTDCLHIRCCTGTLGQGLFKCVWFLAEHLHLGFAIIVYFSVAAGVGGRLNVLLLPVTAAAVRCEGVTGQGH